MDGHDKGIDSARASDRAPGIGGRTSSSEFRTNGNPAESNGYSAAVGGQERGAAGGDVGGSHGASGVQSRYPRISRPVELLRPSYDVVVIGSGYGGAVAASRMARGGQSVCLLERGKERWPGEFPTSTPDALGELHVSGNTGKDGKMGAVVEGGEPTALFHLVVGEGQNALVANGLGGTSLINANVFLEADEKTLNMPIWPPELRGRQAWEKYYGRARDVLEPVPYPESYPALRKLNALRRQAELMGWGDRFYAVPQTTRFVDGPNSTGVPMRASSLSGQDATGVNDGSKSSTLVNYLSDAWNWGAEMFCGCEVRYVTRAPDREGYLVHFAWHGDRRAAFGDRFYEDLMWVHARKFVFLGAGSLGTTEILVRSRERGLHMSSDVGSGMSGNGDILAFGYNTDLEVNSVGRPDPLADRPVGPCITGVIDRRDSDNVLDGFVIEEGAVPAALAPFYELMLTYTPGRTGPDGLTIRQRLNRVLAQVGSRALGPYHAGGSTQRTQCYLIMSHDSDQATLTLDGDRPVVRYSGVGRSDRAKRLHGLLAEMTGKSGGTYVPSPFYGAFGEKEITVHCIGGARISSDGTGAGGGTNHRGQLFTGDGNEVHPGLVVCDGAVVPAALGVNPFATITALAERMVELAAEDTGIRIDLETRNGVLDLFGEPAHNFLPEDAESQQIRADMLLAGNNGDAGLSFTEAMEGFIHIGEGVDDLAVATSIARERSETARFFLSVRSWNTRHLVSDPDHQATLTGTFTCPALGGTCVVQGGTFQLFSDDPRRPDAHNLTYNFHLTTPAGTRLKFSGYKVVDASTVASPSRLWEATTTLYSTISDASNRVVGRGTLYVHARDFLPELRTMQSSGPSILSRAWSLTSFLCYFTAQAASSFFLPFRMLQWPSLTFDGLDNQTTPTHTYSVTAKDGIESDLHMWEPLGEIRKPPQTILFVPGAAVDHQIFALPTIEENAVQYFTRAGYRVYCVVHRVGRTVVAQQGHTTFDARLDVLAALWFLQKQRERQPASDSPSPKPYVVAHCAGSVALACGLLDGTIPADLIGGITASNVFMNPMFAYVNRLKAGLPISPDQLYRLFAGSWFDTTSSRRDSLVQQALNQALRLYPVGRRDEICNSVVCHRSSLVFGRLWSHKNLNEETHARLQDFLGGTSMNSLGHLMYMGLRGYVTNPQGNVKLVTTENIDRLKGIPILFIAGAENTVYTPENTDVSFTSLSTAHGVQWYERQVFEDRGHLDCWMGATANKDVYPRVRRHIERVARGNFVI